jgi:hypothetical protein
LGAEPLNFIGKIGENQVANLRAVKDACRHQISLSP